MPDRGEGQYGFDHRRCQFCRKCQRRNVGRNNGAWYFRHTIARKANTIGYECLTRLELA